MQRHGINVMGVMLGMWAQGRAGSNFLHFDLNPSQMQFLFGSRHNWRRMDPQRFDRDLVQLVASSFVSYLRHR